MGWDGVYMACPKGKERMEYALKGYNWETDLAKARVLDSAMVGTTVYAAIELTVKKTGEKRVRGAVILTDYDKRDGCFLTKHMSEDMGPNYWECPKRILKLLTPTDSEWANQWRENCYKQLAKMAERRKVSAGRLTVGTRIRLHNPDATELLVDMNPYTNRKYFVGFGCHASTRCVNSWGFDVIEEAKA